MSVRQELWNVVLTCRPEFASAFEEHLSENAVAVSVLAPPRKSTSRVEALFNYEPDLASLTAGLALVAALYKTKPPEITIEPVGNLDWLKKVASDFPPIKIARWTVFGSSHKQSVKDLRNKLQIDATNAFGTGEHPTTRGCLIMLDKILDRGFQGKALDMGCGSGILSMAYAQATRCPAVAVDLDPDSVIIARSNARANGLASFIHVAQSRGYTAPIVHQNAPYSLIMANIFARPLCEMAKDLRRQLAPGGIALLSGILNHQVNAVLAAHRQQGLYLRKRLMLGEWSVLVLHTSHP